MVYGGAARGGRVRRPGRHALRRVRSTRATGVRRDRARGHDRLHGRRDRRVGDRAVRRAAVPRAARSLAPPRRKAKLDRAERWFERWEDWAVFLGRLTPVIRSFVSIPAGVFEVPFVRYTLLTLARLGDLVLRASRAPATPSARAGRTCTRVPLRRVPRRGCRRRRRRMARVEVVKRRRRRRRRGVVRRLTNEGPASPELHSPA